MPTGILARIEVWFSRAPCVVCSSLQILKFSTAADLVAMGLTNDEANRVVRGLQDKVSLSPDRQGVRRQCVSVVNPPVGYSDFGRVRCMRARAVSGLQDKLSPSPFELVTATLKDRVHAYNEL